MTEQKRTVLDSIYLILIGFLTGLGLGLIAPLVFA